MTPDTVPQYGEAILIMYSRRAPAIVGSHSTCESWNRLYKLDNLYLDLSLKIDGSGPLLMGKLLTPNPLEGRVRLVAENQEVLQDAELGAMRAWHFRVPAGGVCRLEMHLGGHSFVVRSLDIP